MFFFTYRSQYSGKIYSKYIQTNNKYSDELEVVYHICKIVSYVKFKNWFYQLWYK